MLEPTKMRPTSLTEELLYVCHKQKTYAIPKKLVERYKVAKSSAKHYVMADSVFAKVEAEFGKAAILLKGLRVREALSQVEFAKKIKVTQANLSNMENGRRAIGKTIARRIEKVFGVNYRYFLE